MIVLFKEFYILLEIKILYILFKLTQNIILKLFLYVWLSRMVNFVFCYIIEI